MTGNVGVKFVRSFSEIQIQIDLSVEMS